MEWVTGIRTTPELELYRMDKGLAAKVDARHYALCGCENWVVCCSDRPGFLEEAVREEALEARR